MRSKNILFTGFLLLLAYQLSAQSVSEKRSFIKSIPLSRDARLEVDNKYGDIHITSWKKDSVTIRAEIEAFAPNHSRLQKMLDGIEVNISGTGSLIMAETVFGKEITVLLESFKGITGKIIDYDSRVQISYYINIPEYVDISIENQFGDIFMEDNTGVVSVSLSKGNFEAASLNRISDLSLDFGDADIGSVRSGKINSTFSKIKIEQSDDISINSTSTRFDLGKAGKVNVESRRDKFYIGRISGITGISYFTDYKIETLTGTTDLDLKYGSFDIERVDEGFEKISLESDYSDITTEFDPSASFELEIRHTNAFVVLPDKNIKSEKEVLNEDKKEYLITGKIGNNPGSRILKIEAKRGNIYIK
ncbi:MAG TPA: hypothetical protein DEO60_10690 [Bacteroidales bacterium]|nr:hypothetical protein [Bacteroidales bacterium]HBZ21589.1 hypothetical protein [Bacteroidales bacterium]